MKRDWFRKKIEIRSFQPFVKVELISCFNVLTDWKENEKTSMPVGYSSQISFFVVLRNIFLLHRFQRFVLTHEKIYDPTANDKDEGGETRREEKRNIVKIFDISLHKKRIFISLTWNEKGESVKGYVRQLEFMRIIKSIDRINERKTILFKCQ